MTTLRIALRYIVAKKAHGAVTTISVVSVIAMALATAAIVCVLSVFNGFKSMISSRLDTLQPDIIITAAEGKVFTATDSILGVVHRESGIAQATPTLSDHALVICHEQEMPVNIKGVVADEYEKVVGVSRVIEPEYGKYHGADKNPQGCTISIGAASRLKALPGDGMLIFAPRREGRYNPANPLASFITDSVRVSGVYRTDQSDYDSDGLLIPLSTARRLLQYDTEASAIEIKTDAGADVTEICRQLSQKLGPRYEVLDRMHQQESNFRMVQIEKWVSFLLLGFILIIAGFNIITSLLMLVLDKEKHLYTFAAMGMSRRDIGGIFAWESMIVALLGGVTGIILGVGACLWQIHSGIIKIHNSVDESYSIPYPVELKASDLLVTLLPVLLIGIVTSLITYTYARSRVDSNKK